MPDVTTQIVRTVPHMIQQPACVQKAVFIVTIPGVILTHKKAKDAEKHAEQPDSESVQKEPVLTLVRQGSVWPTVRCEITVPVSKVIWFVLIAVPTPRLCAIIKTKYAATNVN